MMSQLLFITGSLNSQIILDQLETATKSIARSNSANEDDNYRELFLSSIHIDTPVACGIHKLLHSRHFEGLHFGRCSGLVDQVLEMACSCGVSKLSLLCDFQRMETSWCRALGRGLRNEKCQVRKLILQAHLSNELAEALYEGVAMRSGREEDNSCLEELSIPLSNANWQAVLLLSSALQNCGSLKKLSLRRRDLFQGLDEEKLETVINSLFTHRTLEELSVQGASCQVRGIRAIARHLFLPESNLKKLDLSNHRFGSNSLNGFRHLTEALRVSHKLRTLSLSGHVMPDDGVRDLIDALTCCSCKLKELNLSACRISNHTIKLLAHRLHRMGSLKAIWLHDNPFDTESAHSLLAGVNANVEIEQMLLPLNRGKEMKALQQQLEFWLRLNRTGRRLLVSTKPVPPYVWAMLLERANRCHKQGFRVASVSDGAGQEASETIDSSRDKMGTTAADVIYYLLRERPPVREQQ